MASVSAMEEGTNEKGNLVESGNGLPSYTEAETTQSTTPSAPPPSYDSIYGKLKGMKDESDGNIDYGRRVIGYLFCGTVFTLIYIAFLLALPIAMIVIGSKYLNDCPRQRYIPIYLVVAGSFGILKAITNTIDMIRRRKQEADGNAEEQRKANINPLDGVVNLFMTIWFIVGCVWIYSIRTSYSTTPGAADYCNQTLYLFAFWLQTSYFIFLGVCILLCCCGCWCLCCVGMANAKSNN